MNQCGQVGRNDAIYRHIPKVMSLFKLYFFNAMNTKKKWVS